MHPTDDVDANEPMAGQPRTYSQNSEQLRDVSTKRGRRSMPAGPHRRRERAWSEGVSDAAPALFGPLRAGSLTPTCLVSVVRQVCGPDVCSDRDRVRDQIRAEIWARRAPVTVAMITAHAVSYRRHNRWSSFVAHRS